MRAYLIATALTALFALTAQANPSPSGSPSANGNQEPSNAITLDVRPVVGSETLAVSGHAPAGSPLQITMYATFSRFLPDVVITRKRVVADDAGAFASNLPTAPAYFRGAVVTVVVNSPATGLPATAKYTITGTPSVTVPADNLPNDIR